MSFLDTLRKNARCIPILSAVDLVFFMLAGYVFMTFQLRIIDILQGISSAAKANMELLEDATRGTMTEVMQSQKEIMAQLNYVFVLLVVMIVLLYVIYNLCQGFNFTYTISRLRKVNVKNYMMRFMLFNLGLTLVLALVFYSYLRLSVINRFDMLSVFDQGLINWVFIIILLVICYIIYAVYSVLDTISAKSLLADIMDTRKALKFLLSLIVLIMVCGLYLYIFFTGWIAISLVYLLIVLLPVLSVLRFYMLEKDSDK